MLIRFDEIPPEGISFAVADLAWFPDHELKRCGAAEARVNLKREGKRVIFAGEFTVSVARACDRCLEPYCLPLAGRFRMNLEMAAEAEDEGGHLAGREHDCRAEEMDLVYLEAEVVDVADLLVQQLYLSLPLKNLCRVECRGLCPHCGADLNCGTCTCIAEEKASPFAGLRALKLK